MTDEPTQAEAPEPVEAGPDAQASEPEAWTPRPSVRDELQAARSGQTAHKPSGAVAAELKRVGAVAAAPPNQPAESVQLVEDEAALEHYLSTRPDLYEKLPVPKSDEQARANAAVLRELSAGEAARAE